MKSKIHHLVDEIEDEPALERLFNSAKAILADDTVPLATLAELTTNQRQELDRAIQDHEEGKTVSHEEMKQQRRKWLNR